MARSCHGAGEPGYGKIRNLHFCWGVERRSILIFVPFAMFLFDLSGKPFGSRSRIAGWEIILWTHWPGPATGKLVFYKEVRRSSSKLDGGIHPIALAEVNKVTNQKIKRFLSLCASDPGQDIAEYAVMLAVILVIVVGTIRLIGSHAGNVFSQAASAVQ